MRLPKDSLLRKYDEFGRAGRRRNTPAEIVDILNKGINAGLADPKLKARLAELGGVPTPVTLTEFGKHIADDTKKWGKVIRAAHIKAE